MPRPLSWLPRLPDIRRAVAKDNRSHFGRKDLEDLFGLQPRAAQLLLELLPTVPIGTAHLAEREALTEFLENVQAADDPGAFLEALRSTPKPKPRRRLQYRADLPVVTLASLPANLTLEAGRVEVRFETAEELAEAMFALAQVLYYEADAFVDRFELRPEPPPHPERDEIRRIFEELERMEAARR